ncbi:MAG: hypothetical protein ACP5OO_13315 [Chloroflexia bacterium]
MMRHPRRSPIYLFCLLLGLVALGLFLLWLQESTAQIVATNVPIPRHVVLYNAANFHTFLWTPDADSVAGRTYSYVIACSTPPATASYYYTSRFSAGVPVTGVAYKWGGGDFINNSLTPTPGSGNENFGRRLQQTNDLAGDVNNNWHDCARPAPTPTIHWKWTCPYARGVDCSGFVTRVWGRPVGEKWGTSDICNRSVRIPYDAGQREDQLRRRMRMGDVFDRCGDHVVLLYYFDPDRGNIPVYYEARWDRGGVIKNEGWTYVNNYEPYRYRLNTDTDYIRDDIYLPWLSHTWYGWESTLYARNNDTAPKTYVLQHTAYSGGGGDAGAIDTGTYRRTNPFANDLWELPTAILNPGDFYRGGGVVAADTGTSAVVLVQGNGQGLAYSGIFPFDTLGQAAANTLYLPVFLYTMNGNGLLSKVFIQNAGSAAANLTLTYYGDDGRTCAQTFNNLNPWGSTILEVNGCNWGGTPPTSGAVRLNATQPVAALVLEHIYWNRLGGYNGFSQGGKTLYVPELTRNGWGIGWFSTLHLMNVGSSMATINLRYYTYGGQYFCTDTRTLPPNRHMAVDYGDTHTCVAGYGYDLFSARISSDQPLVAAVNQDNATYGDF